MPLTAPVSTPDVSRVVAVSDRNSNAKVCWMGVKQYPYQPDHQVELLHLQAEADALLIKLQANGQKRLSQKSAVSPV